MPSTLILTQHDIFQLYYDQTDELLHGCWLGPVLDADLRVHYTQLLQEAQQLGGCRYWLLDLRRRNWQMPSFVQWMIDEFMPAVQATLGPPVFVAYVVSPRHLSAAARAQEQPVQQQSEAQRLHADAFADEATAYAWLRQQRLAAG